MADAIPGAAPDADMLNLGEPAAVEAPVVDAAPAPEAAPAADAVKHPSEVPTMLEGLGENLVDNTKAKAKVDAPAEEPKEPEAKVDAKPVDKPAEEAKPEEPKAPEVAAAPVVEAPIEYKFELPPELKDEPKEMGTFKELLGSVKAPVEVGQKFLDLHAQALRQSIENERRAQLDTFNKTRENWAKSVMADPEIGGAGHQTAMGAIARMRDMLISNAKPGTEQYKTDTQEFNDFLRITGAGDNPTFLKMLHRVAYHLDEPAPPAAKAIPTKDNGRPPSRSLYKQPAGK